MLEEKTKIAEYVKGLGVKKIVLIVLGVVLLLNILATVTNSRFDSLKAELDVRRRTDAERRDRPDQKRSGFYAEIR